MAWMRIDLTLGRYHQQFVTQTQHIVMGRGTPSNLRVPLAFLLERHLEIDRQGGITRARVIAPDAQAAVGDQPLTTRWRLLGDSAVIQLNGPDQQCLSLSVLVDEEDAAPQLAKLGTDTSTSGGLGAEFIEPQRDSEPRRPPPAGSVPPHAAGRWRLWVLLVALALTAAAGVAVLTRHLLNMHGAADAPVQSGKEARDGR